MKEIHKNYPKLASKHNKVQIISECENTFCDTYLITWMTNPLMPPMKERKKQKHKNAFLSFFYSDPPASPVSGPLHRLVTEQPAFSSDWYMHNATAAAWPA